MIFVGGEFYYDDHWKTDSVYHFPKTHEFNYFLNGGQACLRAIADFLVDHDINQVLLPAYLCPTITKTLSQFNLRLDFYPVMEDFSINLESLAAKASNSKNQAIYFINYFGFTRSIAEQALLQKLQAQGYLLVEDNAQAGFTEKPIGDFVFNSFRKFVPYDGAYLNTSFPPGYVYQCLSWNGKIGAYRSSVNIGKVYRATCFRVKVTLMNWILYLTRQRFFTKKIKLFLVIAQERACIEHLDWEGIRRTRRDNYAYLLKQIDGISGIKPIFPELQANNMPIGLPIYFDGNIPRPGKCFPGRRTNRVDHPLGRYAPKSGDCSSNASDGNV